MRVAEKAYCDCCGKFFDAERRAVAIEELHVIVCEECRRDIFKEMDAHFIGSGASASGEKAAD